MMADKPLLDEEADPVAEVTVTFDLRVPVLEVLDADDEATAHLSRDEIMERVRDGVEGRAGDFLHTAIDLPVVEVDGLA